MTTGLGATTPGRPVGESALLASQNFIDDRYPWQVGEKQKTSAYTGWPVYPRTLGERRLWSLSDFLYTSAEAAQLRAGNLAG